MEQLNLWQFYNFMDLIRDFPEFPSFVLGLEKQLKDKEFKKLIDTVPGFNVQFHHKWAQGLIKSHQDIHQLRNFIKKESQDVIEKQIQQIKQVEENKRGNWYKTETSKTKTTKEVKSQQDLNNKTNTIQKEIGELRSIFKESPHIEKFDKIINKIIQTNCETSFDDQILIVNFGEKLLEVAKKTACIIHQTHDKSEVLNSQIATELFSTYHDASIALSKILLSKNDSFQDYEQMLSETINEKKIDFISLTAFDKEPQISQLINDEIAETEKINTQNNLTYQKVLTPLQEIFSNSIQICHEAIKQEKINQTYQTMFTQRNNWLDLHTKAKQAHEEQIEEIQQYNPVQNLKSKIKKLTKRILKDAIAEPNQNSNKKELEKAQMLELENLVEIFTNILGKKTATDYEKELAKLGLDLTTDAIDAIEEKNIKSYKNIKSKVSTILKTLRVDENKIKKEKDYVLAKEAIYQLEKLEFNLENFVTFEGDSFQSYLHDQTINIINNTSDIFAAYLNDSNINSISSLIYSLLEKSTKCNQNQEIEDSFNLVDYSQKLLTLEQKIALAIQEEDIENIQTKNISTKTITPFIEMVEYPLDTSKSFEKEMEEATLAHCKISHLLNDINLENISAPPLEKIFLDSNEISKNFKDFSNEADIFYGCENVDEKSIKVSGSKFSPPMPDPEDPEDPKNKLKKKIDKILEKTKPGKKTKGPTKQFEKPGNYDDALRDFEKLNPKDVRFDGDTKIGKLSNGKHANVRPSSSKPNPRPTLEIQNGNKTIKIRYIG